MNSETVTPEMILNYLKQFREEFGEFKKDVRERFEQVDKRFEQVDKRFDQVDKRFEQVDKRFEQVDKRFEQIDWELDQIKQEMRDLRSLVSADRDKLQEVHESRDKVTVKFTRAWMTASFFIAITAALVVLAVEKGLS